MSNRGGKEDNHVEREIRRFYAQIKAEEREENRVQSESSEPKLRIRLTPAGESLISKTRQGHASYDELRQADALASIVKRPKLHLSQRYLQVPSNEWYINHLEQLGLLEFFRDERLDKFDHLYGNKEKESREEEYLSEWEISQKGNALVELALTDAELKGILYAQANALAAYLQGDEESIEHLLRLSLKRDGYLQKKEEEEI